MKLSYLNPLLKLKVFISILFISICLNKSVASMAYIGLSITVIEPPSCSFDGGNTLGISFGEVQQALIDGKSYKKTSIDYNFKCTNLSTNLLKMTLSWNNFRVNGVDSIKTNRDNLGIAIYHGNDIVSNNSNIHFIYGAMPYFYAVPIKPDGSMLSDAGNFSAEMIMKIEYQ
ncbi:fimbrial protein [Providencia huaxiensis]|nr:MULTISPECIES: fimbrial protein [Providencia]MCD2529386.1 fimbrial protein [Providencia huaxiensis]